MSVAGQARAHLDVEGAVAAVRIEGGEGVGNGQKADEVGDKEVARLVVRHALPARMTS